MPDEFNITDAANSIRAVSETLVEFCISHFKEMECPTCGFNADTYIAGLKHGVIMMAIIALALLVVVLWWKCYTEPRRHGMVPCCRGGSEAGAPPRGRRDYAVYDSQDEGSQDESMD